MKSAIALILVLSLLATALGSPVLDDLLHSVSNIGDPVFGLVKDTTGAVNKAVSGVEGAVSYWRFPAVIVDQVTAPGTEGRRVLNLTPRGLLKGTVGGVSGVTKDALAATGQLTPNFMS